MLILIVDDDELDRERVSRCLRRSTLNTSTVEAGSGHEAMAILRSHRIDCVLLDNRLGDTTGSVLLQQIRQLTSYNGPIIMVTGAGSESLVVEAMQEGASDYVPKVQLDAERLTQAILRSLRRQESKVAEQAATRQLSHRVAEQEQALRQLDRTLQDILDHATHVIAYWDQNEQVRFGNVAHQHWFGLHPQALGGMSARQVLGEDAYAHHAPHIRLALQGEAQQFEHTLPAREGLPERIVQVEYRPDIDEQGHTQGFYVTMADLTELVSARNAAQESVRLKSAFLANMSHEIRTPMNAILGLLRLTLDKTLPHEVHADIGRAHNAALALMGILDDILDHSKLEAGQLRIAPQAQPLDDILQRTIDLFSGRLTQKQLSFALQMDAAVPQNVLVDGLRLSQVLNNLLGNAVKFTDTGHLGLAVRTTGTPDRIRFEVSDTGTGIPFERQGSLFSAFTQADASITRRFGGSGLGLSICRNLVHLMDGDIGLHSEAGQGSTFWFEVPLPACPPDAPVPEAPPHRVVLWHGAAHPPGAWQRLGALHTAIWTCCPDAARTLTALSTSAVPCDTLVVDGRCLPPPPNPALHTLHHTLQQQGRPWPTVIVLVEGHQVAAWQACTADLPSVHVHAQPMLGDALLKILRQTGDAQHPSHAEASPWSAGQRLHGKRVLLVEDNALNQMVAQAFLEQVGMVVHIVGDGAEAVALLSQTPAHTFDVIFMDMHMPVMDGLEATRHIRQMPAWQDTPIIAMTAAVMHEDRLQCMEAGMVDTLAKPILAEALVELLLK